MVINELSNTNTALISAVFYFAGLASGFFLSHIIRRIFVNASTKNKLYWVDSGDSVKMFLVGVVSFIWIFSTIVGTLLQNPPDLSVHAIMGAVVGAYFGVDLFNKRNNGKHDK